MHLDQNNGSMALPDLKELQELRIPEHRNTLEKSHSDLEALATHCERAYLNALDRDKAAVFEETKRYALQSLAGVAYQINNLARDLSDMLTLQLDKITSQAHEVDNLNLVVNIQKEKMARREIGALTASKSIPKLPKITTPQLQEPITRYRRVPIDFNVLDSVGHGTRSEPPKQPLVSRAPSSVSTANSYGQPYERLAQIGGNNTLSRMRSGGGGGEHYRIPSVVAMHDAGRYSSATTIQQQNSSEYGIHCIASSTGTDYGSQHGSSDYGGRYQDKYGTLRAHQMRPHFELADIEGRPPSPGLPPPPPQLSNYDYYGTINKNRNELPPPAAQLLNSTHEDDDLPPPPGGSYYSPPQTSSNYFDVHDSLEMPKEKKKGLFSLFRKKAPKEQPATVPNVAPPEDSFSDINDLIPTPEIVYKKPLEPEPSPPEPPPEVVKEVPVEHPPPPKTKVDKSKKKKDRAAPPPPQERAVDVGDPGPRKPPREPGSRELTIAEKKALIRQDLNGAEEMSSRKSSASSGSRVVETNVLHYSPQTQHRPSTSSPIPVSEAPPVERQSNIILNGTARVKSIPVSQYDGRPKAAAPPPPPPTVPAPQPPVAERVAPLQLNSVPSSTPPVLLHRKQTSLDSTLNRGVPKLDAPPKAVHRPNGTTRQSTKEEEDLQRRYENIKAKFDLWQAWKNDERHVVEAKKLQMELIRDHDTLLELAKAIPNESEAPSPGQIQKKRPSIAPDTYTPKLPIANNIRSPLTITATSTSSLGSSSPSSSSPGTSRSVTPKNVASSPSVSPAASVDSSDSGVVRGRSEYATPKVDSKKSTATDENANLLKRISAPRDSLEIQRQIAINRINDEVKEQRKKEDELKKSTRPGISHSREVSQEVRIEKPRPLSNGGLRSPAPAQSRQKSEESPRVTSQLVNQTASINRIMVNTSPVPPATPKTTTAAPSPKASPITHSQEKTVVMMNSKTEKVYATPKALVLAEKESPKTPPLPATAQPKLPYLDRSQSVDEPIYKVVSTTKKTTATILPVYEENNNVAKLAPPKERRVPRSPTVEKKKNHRQEARNTLPKAASPVTSRPLSIVEQKPEVTSAIKTTIATSRVDVVVEVKPEVKQLAQKGSVSRKIADTLAKHNTHNRPALDLSVMLDKATLRKVSPPVERVGISMGRVIDTPPPSTPVPSTSSAVYLPAPTPPQMAPPPPPPPPPDLFSSPIYQVPSPVVRPTFIPIAPPAPPPLVTTSQLNDQKQRLRTPIYTEKAVSPLDLRDSLMAEIRNAEGGRGLRKVSRN